MSTPFANIFLRIKFYFLNLIAEEKMSLNPNGYKLSERTGKLTAFGKCIFDIIQINIKIYKNFNFIEQL